MHTIIWKGTQENFIKLFFLSGKTPEGSEGIEFHCWSSLMEGNFLGQMLKPERVMHMNSSGSDCVGSEKQT